MSDQVNPAHFPPNAKASIRPSNSHANKASVAVGAAQATPKKDDPTKPPKLARCPEGQSTLPNQAPCERPRRGKHQGKRKAGFRLPLKKEDGNMESQIIEYNCEFPNRVVVRLEYLMQTTKVRLNDRGYMDDFYDKLVEEERRALRNATRHREKMEQKRMKKLIIEGIDKDIPPEMSYLYKHPVFRVNQMLRRLTTYDTGFGNQNVGEGDEITPVEPYEFNGNQFFKVLHETGDLWVPSAQALYDDHKLEGKIYRAKMRLLQKKREDAAEEKILRIMNNVAANRQAWEDDDDDDDQWPAGDEEGDMYDEDNPPPPKPPKPKIPSWVEEFQRQKIKDDLEDQKLNEKLNMQCHTQPFSTADMAVEKIRAKTIKDANRLREKISRSKQEEREHEKMLDKKRGEDEINYVDTFNYDKARIVEHFEKKQKHIQVDELFDRPDMIPAAAHKSDKEGPEARKPYQEMLKGHTPVEDLTKGASTKYGKEPLFKKLQTVYGVGNSYPFHHFETYETELMDQMDRARNGKELLKFGENIADMYTRELMVADDHVKITKAHIEERLRKKKEESDRLLQEKFMKERKNSMGSNKEEEDDDYDEDQIDYSDEDEGGYEEDTFTGQGPEPFQRSQVPKTNASQPKQESLKSGESEQDYTRDTAVDEELYLEE